jgi:hypothetical protein
MARMATVIHRIIDHQIREWEAAAARRREEALSRPDGLKTIRPAITLARQIGSGGWEIAHQVAERLGWEVFDRELLEVIVRQGHFREAIMNALDEHDRSAVEIWVDGLLHGNIVDKGDYHRTLVRVLTSISMHGRAIIVGRGANYVLDPRRTFNLRIAAPRSVRVEMIARSRGLPMKKAAAIVTQTDHERAAFIMHHFHERIDDPTAYDLVINTASFSREAAAEMVVQALHLKLGGLAGVEL